MKFRSNNYIEWQTVSCVNKITVSREGPIP